VALNEVSNEYSKRKYLRTFIQTSWKTSLTESNQITLPDSGEIILMVKNCKHVQYIGYLPEERGLYTMKVENNACIWPK
jgi:ABC-2 type transport system ATP-binding protein